MLQVGFVWITAINLVIIFAIHHTFDWEIPRIVHLRNDVRNPLECTRYSNPKHWILDFIRMLITHVQKSRRNSWVSRTVTCSSSLANSFSFLIFITDVTLKLASLEKIICHVIRTAVVAGLTISPMSSWREKPSGPFQRMWPPSPHLHTRGPCGSFANAVHLLLWMRNVTSRHTTSSCLQARRISLCTYF